VRARRAVRPAFIGGAVHFLSLTLNYATSGAVAVLVMLPLHRSWRTANVSAISVVRRCAISEGGPASRPGDTSAFHLRHVQ
jgi:hypothetical protein